MRKFSLIFGALVAMGLLAGARPAAADIPPDGICVFDDTGKECSEAFTSDGKSTGQAGVCVAEQCHRATPGGSMSYDCSMCRLKTEPGNGGASNGGASNGGAGGEPAEPGVPAAGGSSDPVEPLGGSAGKPSQLNTGATAGNSKGGSASTAGTSSNNKGDSGTKDDGGCSIGGHAGRAGIAAFSSLVVLGLILGGRRRRRSQRS